MRYCRPVLIFFLMLGWFLPAQAQRGDDSLALVYKKWHLEQRKIIQLYMDLQEYEKAGFWDVYDSYSRAIEFLEIDYLRIITLHTQHSNDLSDDKEMALASYFLKNELMLAHVRKQYFQKFRRALTSSRAGEFMQLEHSMRTVFRLNLQKNDPLYAPATEAAFSQTIQ